jgi:hypothetical protein
MDKVEIAENCHECWAKLEAQAPQDSIPIGERLDERNQESATGNQANCCIWQIPTSTA